MPNETGIKYDEDYYERGIETGKSAYHNYRWISGLTIPMAMTIIDFLNITRDDTILDFGCAKGYLVKALRLLYRQAWGVDESLYAIKNCDSIVKQFCSLPSVPLKIPNTFDLCIAKDVFEHIEEEELVKILKWMPVKRLFAVIPLGDSSLYRAPINNADPTHVICANEIWWINFFVTCGYEIVDFRFQIPGIKDNYYEKYPDAHGFFRLFKK